MKAALYIHVPFCARKCAYCDFVSARPQRGDMERFTDCILREAERWPLSVTSLYLGGGTPGLLPVPLMEKLIRGLRERMEFLPGERTLEANPESVTPEKARCWKELGFNRLSMGLQAAQSRFSDMLGRKCDPERYRMAFAMAREAGFANISGDLMTGLPGQRPEDLLESVGVLTEAGAEHISLYELTLHEATPLGRRVAAGELVQPADEEDRALFSAACDALAARGYHRYEISNFAREGYESRHNLVYWHNEPYLGLGPSAASSLEGCRWVDEADFNAYCAAVEAGESPIRSRETVSAGDAAFETLMLGLRLTEGVDRRAYLDRHGFDFLSAFHALFSRWQDAGLAVWEPDRLRLTPAGLDVQNPLLVELMEDFDSIDIFKEEKA